ncbi:MAG: hypothetical protein V4729_08750 [Pseudomonadota bacterium]
MLQMTSRDIDKARDDSLRLLRRRAPLAALAAMVPVAGLDVLADARLLDRLLPEITERFGLSPAQLRDMPTAQRERATWQLHQHRPGFCGQVSRQLLLRRNLGGQMRRLLATQVAKFIPLGGSAVAGWLGYDVVARIARDYIDQCQAVARAVWNEGATTGPGPGGRV